jgi:hypothetical protein
LPSNSNDEGSILPGENYVASLCDRDGVRVLEDVKGGKERDSMAMQERLFLLRDEVPHGAALHVVTGAGDQPRAAGFQGEWREST